MKNQVIVIMQNKFGKCAGNFFLHESIFVSNRENMETWSGIKYSPDRFLCRNLQSKFFKLRKIVHVIRMNISENSLRPSRDVYIIYMSMICYVKQFVLIKVG